MQPLQAAESKTLAQLKSTLQRDVNLSHGDVKYLAFDTLKGLQWTESGAGGVKNLLTPAPPPPEVRTGLIMDNSA